ncbi:putative pseudouridine synthase TruD/Pus7 [Cladophialophora carrionii]|uniref:Putative pseudouridine synthase TruD/Pus7 n=1 Tax=Cladophialophora carrionii TaxID=86049 RepID=A0A1C1CMS6_9EURO|nr:putative pseudouridine synthase TruD/Pus7 [Cladophialophora carrionii]
MNGQEADSRPPKRVKLDSSQVDVTIEGTSTMAHPGHESHIQQGSLVSDDTAKERQVGITAFVGESRPVFRGILKKRYTDFLVNEILPNGTVVHLSSIKVQDQAVLPKPVSTASAVNGKSLQTTQETAPEQPTPEGETGEKGPNVEKTTGPEATKGQDANGESAQVNFLPSSSPTKVTKNQIPEADHAILLGYFSDETVGQMASLYQSILRHPDWKSRDHPMVRTEFTSDRNIRSQIHQNIRRIFNSKIDSSTDKDGILVLTASHTASTNNRDRNRAWNSKPNNDRSSRLNKLSWQDRGGEYLHFSLYKENKDTLEVVSYLTKQLKTNTKTFQFAGTKDRRAVTVQRVSAYRVEAERLAGLNRSLKYAAVGDFEYHKQGLELGDLSGNEFVITLRECQLEASSSDNVAGQRKAEIHSYLHTALHRLREKGFLNFYGLQRFGTFATRTDIVGLHILKGDFKSACDSILEFSPSALNEAASETGVLVGQDDRSRAEGINLWRNTGRINEALDKIPRKFSAESNIIRHLGRHRQDYLGALLGIQRNLRLMYVHAYQSLVWNLAVGERWRLYGDKVVEGDLVLVREHKDKEMDPESAAQETVDADGEIVIEPSGDDRAFDKDDMFERARALTAEEAKGGEYSIFDIVLPLPGFDVLYPANAGGEWYKTFMASEAGGGLDPYNMRRKQKDFSLSGGYRKILARIGEVWEVNVHEYGGENEGEKQFVETDLERIKKHDQKANQGVDQTTVSDDAAIAVEAPNPPQQALTEQSTEAQHTNKLAAVLKFQLGSSQYATMALRELSKGGVQAYKAEFLGGR